MENKYLQALLNNKSKQQALSEKRMTQMPYQHYMKRFGEINPRTIAEQVGLDYHADSSGKGYFDVKMMDTFYRVHWPSGMVEPFEESSPNYKAYTMILRWLLNTNHLNQETEPEALSYKQIPGGNHYFQSYEGRVLKRSAYTFGSPKKYEALEKAAQELGGGKRTFKDFSVRFQFLPKVFITLILHEADEEFGPDCQILYDSNITESFDAEDLAVMGDLFIPRLQELVKKHTI